MGSFSVACGMSHIPITGGEHVLFVPITKNRYLSNIPLDHFFCYSDDLYEPALLPIEGYYNSYGTIENIIKNEHTDYLEKKFSNSIEIILHTITRKRDLFSKYGDLAYSWNLNLCFGNDLELFSKLGFSLVQEENSSYMYLEKHKLKIFSKESYFSISDSYTIIKGNKSLICHLSDYNSLQELIFLNFDILLGVSDLQKEIALCSLCKMGGQFFLKSIFDEMTTFSFYENNLVKSSKANSFNFSISELHLLDLGFIKKEDKKYYFGEDLIIVDSLISNVCSLYYNNKFHKFFTLREFLNFFSKKKLFDEDKLNKYTFFKTKLLELKDLLKEELVELNNLKEEYIKDGKDFSSIDRIMKRSSDSLIERHIFCSNSSKLSKNYTDYFYDTALSFDINKDYFLLEYYNLFSKFKASMVATNTLFVPSFCGYQDGAKEITKYLAKVTLNVLNKKNT